MTTGSGELPAHIPPHPIAHGYDPEDRFGRGSGRKAEASRYAVLSTSNKPDSASARSMHASPARLIITSGGSSRDSPTVRAASGDLLRADSEPNRAQRAPSISLVTAPDPGQTPAAERPLQAATPSHRHPAEQPGSSLSDAALGANRAPSSSQSLPHAEAQQASPYRQQAAAALGLSQQQASAAGQMHPPFASRVDSLSHWGRQGDAQQQHPGSLQSDAVSVQQGGDADFQQKQKSPSPVRASQGGLTAQEQQQLLLKQQQHFQQAHTKQHRVVDQKS